LDNILSRLENEIIPQKAQSILVNRGSDRASKALVDYEGVLKVTEDAAQAKEDEWRSKVGDARRQLANFVERAKKIIDDSAFANSKGVQAQDIANDIVVYVLDGEFVNSLASHAVQILREKRSKFYWTNRGWKQDVTDALRPFVLQDIKDSQLRAIKTWKSNSRSNSYDRLWKSLRKVCGGIHDLWIDGALDSNELLNGFESPDVPDTEIDDIGKSIIDCILDNTSPTGVLAGLRRRWFVLAVDIFLGTPILVYHYLKGNILGVETDLLKGIRSSIEQRVSSTDVHESMQEPIRKQVLDSLGKMEQLIREKLETLKVDFEKNRVLEIEKVYSSSLEERRCIAEKNHIVRTEKIEPLRKRIETFRDKVISDLST